jgi:predicted dehydrogenase
MPMPHHPEVTDMNGRPVRVVLSGCGAVSRLYTAPALAQLASSGFIEVAAIYDPDSQALSALRKLLPSALPTPTFEAMLGTGAELAIIAAPPGFHAEQVIAALGAGLHVLCEKPLATRLADAERMLEKSAAIGRFLTVGLVRRHFPATRTIKEFLDCGLIGSVKSVSWFEGGPFDWPVSSPRYFSKEEAGGGVLLDIGTHCLDLLSWWLGSPTINAYEDDAMGGVEANCLLHLDCAGADVRMRLSRDWARPNQVVLHGSRGWIRWRTNDTLRVDITLSVAGISGSLSSRDVAGNPPEFVRYFERQIADVVDAVRLNRPPVVPADTGRDVVALIEACYAARRPMKMGWFSEAERIRADSRSMEAR